MNKSEASLRMNFIFLIKGAFILLLWSGTLMAENDSISIYLDDAKAIEDRVEDALTQMTLEEKIAMCHAQSKFSSAGVPRLGIPDNWMTDGPHGIRPEVLWDEWNQAEWTNDSCFAFPVLICLAATWNPELARLYGKSIGEEARYRNKNVLLGPGVNIYRTPLNGRNFEYMGEDPYLASRIVVPYVQGVQSNGVAACVKHFALNNQEVNRYSVNVNVSDRALYEIYLPAFKAAIVEGNAWSIMGAYNRYKGEYCCHNQYLLNGILRGEWKFDGVVVSDWGGVHDTYQAAYNGLDMEFGTGTDGLASKSVNPYDSYYLAKPYLNKIRSGEISEETLNLKVRNILRLVFRTNMDKKRPWGSFTTGQHALAGRTIGEEGIVLLQNKNSILPIDLDKVKKIAIIGENAIKTMTVGGGSSSLKVKYEISPLEGLKKRIGERAGVVFARGYVSGALNTYNGVTTGVDISDSRSKEELQAEAQSIAKDADVVLFVGGLNKMRGQDSEGADRKGFGLPYDQNELIEKIAKANKNVVVVLVSGNAVAMPWVNRVGAIVQAWFLGSEAGSSLASVVFGDVNPSGKLPMTYGVKLDDYGSHALGEYPGGKEQIYNEGIFVGYRWFDRKRTVPLFSFGHGLSYTQFSYGKATISSKKIKDGQTLSVSIPVKNIGKRSGKEIVQLYIGDVETRVERPIKELKSFEKISLEPNETKKVKFDITVDDLKFFDEVRHAWTAEPGKFKAYIGASSSDIRSILNFELK